MTVMAGATIAPALPQIQQFFRAEPNSEFWVKAGTFPSQVFSQPIAQKIRLGVTYGVAGIMILVLAIFLVGASVKRRLSTTV
ncbi:MAG TPA: hypothetical protein V6D50_05815 [Chroococcales cyanobacterium]|jgi:hypothetical protein